MSFWNFCRYQSRYVHLHNLLFLFDFVFPTVSDYCVSLKLGDFEAFRKTYLCMLKFYLSCRSEGISHEIISIILFLQGVFFINAHVSLLSYPRILGWETAPNLSFVKRKCNFFFWGIRRNRPFWFIALIPFESEREHWWNKTMRVNIMINFIVDYGNKLDYEKTK